MSLQPIVSLPVPPINGLVPAYVTTTALSISAGQCWMPDAEGILTYGITVEDALSISSATSGLGGLDTGTIAASTLYYIHVVADAAGFNIPGAIISLSRTAPVMPEGTVPGQPYNIFKNVGFALTNGSSQFVIFWVSGTGATRTHWWDTAISELSGGTSTTYAAVDLATSVPPIDATPVYMNALYTPAGAANTSVIIPGGSTATTALTLKNAAAVGAYSQIKILSRLVSSIPTIQYKVTASDTLTLLTLGFEYYL